MLSVANFEEFLPAILACLTKNKDFLGTETLKRVFIPGNRSDPTV